jgi:hypothetical protein
MFLNILFFIVMIAMYIYMEHTLKGVTQNFLLSRVIFNIMPYLPFILAPLAIFFGMKTRKTEGCSQVLKIIALVVNVIVIFLLFVWIIGMFFI